MITEALKDKSKKGKETVRLLTSIDEFIAKGTIKAYLERCKFKYILAFLQWRGMSGVANLQDL